MADPDGSRIMQNYMTTINEAQEKIAGQMAWPVDWVKEPMPLENASGTSMIATARNYSDVGFQMYKMPPPVDAEVENAPPAPPESVLIFPDSYGFVKGIIDHAPAGRIGKKQYVTKPPGKITDKEIKALLANTWDLVIFACGVDISEDSSVTAVHERQADVTRCYFNLLQQAVRDEGKIKKIAILCCDAFAEEKELFEELGMAATTNCTLFGFTNSARLEMDGVSMHYIDTEWALTEENMPYLSSEVFRNQTFGRNSVRILNRGRYVLRMRASTHWQIMPEWYPRHDIEYPNKFVLPDDGIIGIGGGNGALGLVMGNWILDQAELINQVTGKAPKFKIQFLSRSMKISDQNMPNWKAIQMKAGKLGMEVEQSKCDVGTQKAVDEYISSVTPNLVGFIHSAGVLKDGMLMNQTWEKFEEVFDSKSRAGYYLHDALERFENPRLAFFWVFSSMATWGNMGQTNYSASNAQLDGLVRFRHAMGKPATAMQWGAWGEVGMASNLDAASKARMANSPMPPFSNREGTYGMEQGLMTGLPYFAVQKMNPQFIVGMVQPDDMMTMQYNRNFYSMIAPLPPPQKTDDFHLNTLVAAVREEEKPECKVYDYYCKKYLEED